MDYVVWRLAEKNSGKPDAMLMRINQLGAERSSEVTVMARSSVSKNYSCYSYYS
jgi:hypothetical protein